MATTDTNGTYAPLTVTFEGVQAPCPAETEEVLAALTSLAEPVEFSEIFVRIEGRDQPGLLYVTSVSRDSDGDIIIHATEQD